MGYFIWILAGWSALIYISERDGLAKADPLGFCVMFIPAAVAGPFIWLAAIRRAP